MTAMIPTGKKAAFAQLVLAMNLSLGFGLVMIFLKGGAWWFTGSSAILGDAAESLVHLFAVAFASYSLRLSYKPADAGHPYGHAKVSFFSAGFEGGMIFLASLYIIGASMHQWITGAPPQNLGFGALLTAATVLINGGLGSWLVWLGRRRRSLILEANGHHVLTDCWTSVGVLAALGLVRVTGWTGWDPLCGVLMGLHILLSGYRLIARSVSGLMDRADPAVTAAARGVLERECPTLGCEFHALRVRPLGDRSAIEFHVLVPPETPVSTAHGTAHALERALAAALDPSPYVVTHIEPLEKRARDSRPPGAGA